MITKVMIIEVVSITFLGEDKRMKEENIMKMAWLLMKTDLVTSHKNLFAF